MELKQPKPLYMLFMLEIWERYGYYSLQTIILYSIFHLYLDLSLNDAAIYFGAFFALIFGLVFIGGYIGDKILGAKRTIVLGLIVLGLGYLFLSLAPYLAEYSNIEPKILVFIGLAIVCTGSGLFKANPSNLLSRCYEKNDPRLRSGFTLFYMSINCGSVIADFCAPIIAKAFGWNIAMFLCFIGLIFALSTFFFFKHTLVNVSTEAGQQKLTINNILKAGLITCLLFIISIFVIFNPLYALAVEVIAIICCISFYLFKLFQEANTVAKRKMLVALILIIEAIAFFILYAQKSSSINAYAIQNVDPTLFGLTFNPQSFQALNPFWIIVLSPFLAKLYIGLEKRNKKLSFATKFSTGLTLTSLAFFILYFSHFFANASYEVSAWWIVLIYLFFSLSELLVSALGLAMISDLVNEQIRGTVMGMWFLATAVAGSVGGYVAAYIIPSEHLDKSQSLVAYGDASLKLTVIMLGLSIITWSLVPFLKKLNPNK
jgi:POT family proton-dependent oligopeptide transporter